MFISRDYKIELLQGTTYNLALLQGTTTGNNIDLLHHNYKELMFISRAYNI